MVESKIVHLYSSVTMNKRTNELNLGPFPTRRQFITTRGNPPRASAFGFFNIHLVLQLTTLLFPSPNELGCTVTHSPVDYHLSFILLARAQILTVSSTFYYVFGILQSSQAHLGGLTHPYIPQNNIYTPG